jgi:hypothetical protein
VWFDGSNSIVYVEATGDTKADFAIAVIGVTQMSASDFIL